MKKITIILLILLSFILTSNHCAYSQAYCSNGVVKCTNGERPICIRIGDVGTALCSGGLPVCGYANAGCCFPDEPRCPEPPTPILAPPPQPITPSIPTPVSTCNFQLVSILCTSQGFTLNPATCDCGLPITPTIPIMQAPPSMSNSSSCIIKSCSASNQCGASSYCDLNTSCCANNSTGCTKGCTNNSQCNNEEQCISFCCKASSLPAPTMQDQNGLLELNKIQTLVISDSGFFPFSNDSNNKLKNLFLIDSILNLTISNFTGGACKIAPAADLAEVNFSTTVDMDGLFTINYINAKPKNVNNYGIAFVPVSRACNFDLLTNTSFDAASSNISPSTSTPTPTTTPTTTPQPPPPAQPQTFQEGCTYVCKDDKVIFTNSNCPPEQGCNPASIQCPGSTTIIKDCIPPNSVTLSLLPQHKRGVFKLLAEGSNFNSPSECSVEAFVGALPIPISPRTLNLDSTTKKIIEVIIPKNLLRFLYKQSNNKIINITISCSNGAKGSKEIAIK